MSTKNINYLLLATCFSCITPIYVSDWATAMSVLKVMLLLLSLYQNFHSNKLLTIESL